MKGQMGGGGNYSRKKQRTHRPGRRNTYSEWTMKMSGLAFCCFSLPCKQNTRLLDGIKKLHSRCKRLYRKEFFLFC